MRHIYAGYLCHARTRKYLIVSMMTISVLKMYNLAIDGYLGLLIMAIGDLFALQITVIRPGVEKIQNLYTYEQTSENTSATFNSATLIGAWYQDVWPSIAAIVSVDTLLNSAYCWNLFNEFDFTEVAYTDIAGNRGSRGGDYAPPFVAWSFRSTRVSREIRRGFKRFGLVAVTDIIDGAANPVIFGALNTVGTALGATIQDSGVVGAPFFRPMVVGRYKYTSPAGKDLYRLPESFEEADEAGFYHADTWQYQRLTSQNSRKFGRGA